MSVFDFKQQRDGRPYKFLLLLGQGGMMWELRAKAQEYQELEDWAVANLSSASRWIIAESKQQQNT